MSGDEELSQEYKDNIIQYLLSAAKIKILEEKPIDYSVLCGMNIMLFDKGDKKYVCDTAFTDGIKNIGLCRDFIIDQTLKYSRIDKNLGIIGGTDTGSYEFYNMNDYNIVVVLLLHEIRHKSLRFFHRLGSKKISIYNVAQDFIINSGLKQYFPDNIECMTVDDVIQYIEFLYDPNAKVNTSQGCMLDHDLDLDIETSDSIYDLLTEKIDEMKDKYGQPDGISGDISGEFLSGGDIDADAYSKLTPDEIENEYHDLKNAIIKGMDICKSRGVEPGNFYIKLNPVGEIKPNFRLKLTKSMKRHYTQERLYRRPNRRKLVLYNQCWPGRSLNKSSDIAIIVDTSASCFNVFEQFFATINGILKHFPINKTHVIQVDTKVRDHTIYSKGEQISKPEIHGVGGTEFEPGFKHLVDKKIKVSRVIYLTDGYGDYHFKSDYDTLWIIVDDGPQSPWGENINIYSEDYHRND